ncbi:hypothetical protein PCNPT3_02665 [Psychromonas sp. CNPT3]|uniref:LysR family transcriptional regulator n=1 Tax=Psychromonas sp. CNPT3 TaxID=314282 RepID=UPI00006E50A9|nr:LysR family transcriptional regulator [Psychromonas sp. CNPT3]AGH80475.1 hypothetical protein PCNPT3_02665 [Psychromonas sp. CNPT3]
MKLSQLNAFRAVIECQTVTSAAERLNLSQPSVSRSISALERKVGFKLFIRKGNRLLLSDEGKAFYFEVANVFDALISLDRAAVSISGLHFGSFKIGIMPLFSDCFLPRILASILKQSGKMKLSVKTERSESVLQRVQSQTIDIGLALIDGDHPGVMSQKVITECVCLIPASSPLAKLDCIDIYDLAGLILIRHEKDRTQLKVDRLLRRYNISVQESVKVSFASTAAALVKECVGIAITDPFTAYTATESDSVVMRPLKFSLPFEFSILYPSLKPLHRYASLFIEHFKACADEANIALNIGPIINLDKNK